MCNVGLKIVKSLYALHTLCDVLQQVVKYMCVHACMRACTQTRTCVYMTLHMLSCVCVSFTDDHARGGLATGCERRNSQMSVSFLYLPANKGTG